MSKRKKPTDPMTCDCGEPLVIVENVGVVCPGPKCVGREARKVVIDGEELCTDLVAQRWPDRVVSTQTPREYRRRLKQFEEGINSLQ